MKQSIILGIGTGRCGTGSLAKVLNQQGDTVCSYEEPPLLPWRAVDARRVLRERFARFRTHAKARLLGDVALFYLPYLEEAIALEPDIRIVCLRRPREEVVTSFCEWLDQSMPLPTNHWARQPAPGWHHDANRTRTFPQYDTQNREEGIRRYWDEYYRQAGELAARHPEQIRVFDTYEALNTEPGLRDLLGFVGIPPEQQVLNVGTRVDRPPERSKRWRPRPAADNPLDPRRCVILVPFASSIHSAVRTGTRTSKRCQEPFPRREVATETETIVPATFVLFYNTENRWIGENICNGSGLIEHETRFAYDGDEILMQFDEDFTTSVSSTYATNHPMSNANLSHRYLWQPDAVDQLMADEQVTTPGAHGNVVYPLTDQLGTIHDLAVATFNNSTGLMDTTVVNHIVYNAFGNVVSSTNPSSLPTVTCLFGYTGRPDGPRRNGFAKQ